MYCIAKHGLKVANYAVFFFFSYGLLFFFRIFSLFTTPVRTLMWKGHVACIKEQRNAYRVLVEMAERKRPTGQTRLRCAHNFKIDLRETGFIWL
jgi:hypothetical protein